MTRKGELSKLTIDREFPHQVGIPASEVEGAGYRPRHDFANELGACVRGHAYRLNRVDHVVFCFPTREAADTFMARFGGTYYTPQTRPPWIEKRR